MTGRYTNLAKPVENGVVPCQNKKDWPIRLRSAYKFLKFRNAIQRSITMLDIIKGMDYYANIRTGIAISV